ncbi:hypothetical protein LLG46_04845 [bacterium]|nr:hypothetical protein [bacterium]
MPGSFIQWLALVGIVAIPTVFLVELRKWQSPGSVVGRRLRILRVILISILELLLIMILAGGWVALHVSKLAELIYWFICILLGLAVVVLATFDLLAVMKGYSSVKSVLRGVEKDERK